MNRTNTKSRILIAGTIILCMVVSANFSAFAQQQPRQPQPPLTETILKSYTELPAEQRQAENKRFLDMYDGLRVADVRDGMDWFGYIRYGSLDPAVRPLWPTYAFGIARTVRYLPYVGPAPVERGDAYTQWQGAFYGSVATYPWMNQIEDGDFMAIDVSGVNVGLLGSENTIRGHIAGVRGYVLNGSGIRDTDEVTMQKIPVWSHFVSQAMVQGRIQFESTQTPIAIGGVAIFPGDMIVADNDGVIVVPRAVAEKVAKQAHTMHSDDMATRKRLYEQAGWEFNASVEDDQAAREALYERMGW